VKKTEGENPDGSCCDDHINQCNVTTHCDGEKEDDSPAAHSGSTSLND